MESGQEVIVGMKRDPQFGPVIVFGLGGIFVEILKDTSLRISPIDKKQALEMIQEIHSYPLLCGARGKKPVNINALVNIIIKTSSLAEKNKKILDVGCATGYLAKEFKNNNCHVVGIELDKEAATVAEQYCSDILVGDVEQIRKLPYPDEFFDVIC